MAEYRETVNGRNVLAGESGADEYLMSDAHYAQTQANSQKYEELSKQWQAATAAGQTDKALDIQKQQQALHNENEAIRAQYGYLGGDTGGGYTTLGSLGLAVDDEGRRGSSGSSGSSGVSIQPGTTYGANEAALRSQLEQWKKAAIEQANAQIDYGVDTSTKELERALLEAQPQFQEQAESVARDERQGLDNSALYAELRGDKGGIGQSQYNEIQAQAAQNRLAVQQAQTKLSTDTARQIEDLRAQGEFEKADAALQISQQYLQQLMSLEQWAAEYNLSAAQFEASLQQWEYEYQLSMAQLNQNQEQFNAQLKYNYASLGQSQSQYQTSQLSSMGQALLAAGIMPSTEQLAAMGITEAQASQYIQASQLSAYKSTGTKKASDDAVTQDYEALFQAAQASGNPKSYIANNLDKYGFTSNTGLYDDYKVWAGIITDVSQLGKTAKSIASQMAHVTSQANLEYLSETIKQALANRSITQQEADFLLRAMGY